MTRPTASEIAFSSAGEIEMQDEDIVDLEQKPEAIPFVLKLALVALCLVEVDSVVHGNGDGGSHLLHERENVIGVSGGRRAAEAEDSDPPVRGRQGQPTRHSSPVAADELEHWQQLTFLWDGDDGSLLCFPDGRRRPTLGDCRRRKCRRHDDIGRLQHDQTHPGARFVVEDQRQIVERDDGMEVVGEHLEQLGQRLVASQRLRNAQQSVVT